MDVINQSISNNVKTGQYYIDAKNWYLRRFTYSIIERSYLGLIAIVCIVIIFETLISITKLVPTKVEMPVAIKIEDTLNNIAVIKKISNKDQSTEKSIKEFLLRRYVVNRENYNFENIQNQINVIKNSSLKYIFKKFYEYIDLNNPDSPLLYQNQKSRNVEIISVIFTKTDSAIIKFRAIEINAINKTTLTDDYIANISFQIEDIFDIVTSKQNKHLNFVVTEYMVEKVSK